MKMQVPIEMLDVGIGAATSATTWERSKTSLDTTDYDGNPVYEFEIVYTNADTSTRAVVLNNDAAAQPTGASITCSASVVSPTRARVSFTPTSGANHYRIVTPITTTSGNLRIFQARIIITQDATATKTRIYIPLCNIGTDNTDTSTTGAMDTSTSASYGQPHPDNFSIFKYDLSRLRTIAATNPYTLSVSMLSDATTTVKASLFNTSNGNQVTNSEVSLTSASITLQEANFSSDTNLIDGNEFELRMIRSSGTGNAQVMKAGLYIRLTSLSAAEAYFRIAKGMNNNSTMDFDHGRVLIDTTKYTFFNTYLECTTHLTGGGNANNQLINSGTQDSGTGGASVVDTITPSSSTKTRQRDKVILTSGNRFYMHINVTSGTLNESMSVILIQAESVGDTPSMINIEQPYLEKTEVVDY